MTCQSCGGIIGRDCFNPQECAWIGQQQEQAREQEQGRGLEYALAQIEELKTVIESLKERLQAVEFPREE